MTEDEARAWIEDRFGAAGLARMNRLVELIATESAIQNLIAPSTLATIWTRHIVDSAQLLAWAADRPGSWLDIGTGAGFPGLVIAALSDRPVVLVEPRRKRADFLRAAARDLVDRDRVTVVASKVEGVTINADVISARAVSSLTSVLASAQHCCTPNSLWILPKGKSAREEIATARETWHGVFHVEHSLTNPDSLIVLAKGVSRR